MVLIRADANEKIGMGHVMRCLSIACAFQKKGEQVVFVTADHRAEGLITQQGFETVCLVSDWTDLEREKIDEVVTRYKPDLLVLDSYYVTQKYINMLKKIVRIAYIDDLNNSYWNVDYLINYNIFANVLDYSAYKAAGTKLLLNPRFAPLRDEFKGCPKHEIKEVTDILVSAGGADPERIIEKLIKEVCSVFPRILFHLIVGALNPRLEAITKLVAKNANAVLHINEKHMSDLMKNCDIAISAAGSTLYELCATGVPTITYTLADNQLIASEQFDSQGIMFSAQDCRGDEEFPIRIRLILQRLIKDPTLRSDMSRRMQNLVDGNGADRIVDELLSNNC